MHANNINVLIDSMENSNNVYIKENCNDFEELLDRESPNFH